MITFRTFTTADIPAGLSLCRMAGWNQVAADWRSFLSAGPEGSRVSIDSTGRIAGTVTTIGYGAFSWIGMLLVHPDFRRMGIGSALLEEAVKIIGSKTTSRLDATPAGRDVYLKLGFKDQYNLIRMVCSAPIHQRTLTVEQNIRKMTKDDLPQIKAWDALVFGADRTLLLSLLLSSENAGAWIYEAHDNIKGYVFSRKGHDFSYAGPLVASEVGVAIALLFKMLDNSQGHKIAIDIPGSSAEWKAHLEAIGFVEQRPFIRMYHGKHPGDGVLNETFAIAGPEYG